MKENFLISYIKLKIINLSIVSTFLYNNHLNNIYHK